MRNFDWEAFKRYELRVKITTKEDELDFLEQCEKREIKWNENKTATACEYLRDLECVYYTCDEYLYYSRKMLDDKACIHWTKSFSENKLNIKEVISTIQNGEVYKCGDKVVSCKHDTITIGDHTGCLSVSLSDEFVKYEEIDFMSAYELMKQGKEVKCLWNDRIYTIHKGMLIKNDLNNVCGWVVCDDGFETLHIDSKWTIVG